MDKRWASAPSPRHQLVVFAPSVDDAVPPDHAVRFLEACLSELDWTAWEARYDGHRGQPPIHPMLMAGGILYGLMTGIRSSRRLEEATRVRLDFIWFLEGRTIDHTTFANFRKDHGDELKVLNRQISRLICERQLDAVLELVIDGTRIRANSDRHGARTAVALERLIERCAKELDAKLSALGEQDESEGLSEPDAEALESEVAALEAELEKCRQALEVARKRDEVKRKIGGKSSTPVRVPVTDSDSSILPNKEGGYAPNYTPTVAVDATSGAIVDSGVVPGGEEGAAVQPAVEASEEVTGRKPARILADSGFASGENLQAVEGKGIESYMPTGTDFRDSNPANRPDPTQPVPQDRWNNLPRTGKRLGRAAFVYDAASDQYYCPMGKVLVRRKTGHQTRTGVAYTEYGCPGRAGCPLACECIPQKAAHRRIMRDVYQDIRDTVGRRMATPEGAQIYRRRAPIVEGVLGYIKHQMGVRHFLVRGLNKVRTEWNWVCGAYNLKKLLRLMAATAPVSGIPGAFQGPASRPTSALCRFAALFAVIYRGTRGQLLARFRRQRRFRPFPQGSGLQVVQ